MLKRTDADKEEVKKEEAKAVISENGADAAAERTGVKERVKEVIPIDEYLGIDKLPYKMTSMMMNQTAFWGQNQSSFKKAEEVMNNMLNIKMTDELIRDVTYYVGKKVFDSDTVNAEKIDKTMANMAYTRDKEGVLFRFRGECPGTITASSRNIIPRCLRGIIYLMLDGSMVNTRTKDDSGSTWQENKLGMAFNSNDLRARKPGKDGVVKHDILKKEYTAYIGKAEEFGKHLFDCALRNGYGQYKTTVIIGDGATWIRNMCDDLFPDAIQILDLYHLAENIYSFAKYLHNNDSEKYIPWAERLIGMAKNSQGPDILKELEPYKDKVFPSGVPNLWKYVQNNLHKIDYAAYKEKGYYVGSGPIESGNKTVVQKRCKQTGMMWDKINAQYMLSLRAKEESHLWAARVQPLLLSA